MIQKIIFARTEEILELCDKSIKLNQTGHFKMILIGGGSKILGNEYMDKMVFSQEIDLLDESNKDICDSALKLTSEKNKQEVVVVPKKHIKKGFFEKFFHFFR